MRAGHETNLFDVVTPEMVYPSSRWHNVAMSIEATCNTLINEEEGYLLPS